MRTALVLFVVTASASAAAAAEPPAGVKAFVAAHCLSCHNEKQAKAGFRIDLLGTDFAAAKTADHWKEAIDRVNLGEMPPDGSPRPKAAEIAAFVDWVNGELKAAAAAANGAGGRIPMRRLNRDEYANTIRDLLGLDPNVVGPLAEELPGDGKAEGFDRLGVALYFDQTQIERSLSVAEKVAARAIVTEQPKSNRIVNKFPFLRAKPPGKTVESYVNSPHQIPRGADTLFIKPEYVEFLQGGNTYTNELKGWGTIDHFAVGKVVTRDGDYRFRIKATADDRGRTEKNKLRIQYANRSPIFVEMEVELDPSGTTEVTLFLRGPDEAGEVKGPQVFSLLWNHTENAVIPEPEHFKLSREMTGLSRERERKAAAKAPQKELDDLRVRLDAVLEKLNTWKGPRSIYNPALDVEKLPRLRVESIEVEGPVQKEWPPASHKALGYEPGARQDEAYAREILAKFLPRAYRRPVTKDEIDGVVKIVADALAAKQSFPEAMRAGIQRVLCSPHFLFIGEPAGASTQPRPLTEYEFATRLSYFLWSTMPDEQLFALAAAGKLKADALAQVKRMLTDPKAGEFVRNFAGQWLNVREYGSIEPAATYRNYDKALERASKQEPFEFLAEVLRKDEPITAFLDSAFLVLNERLATHYGIEGVTGPEFRRVAIRPEHHRGGVLGMAGLMTFLADGTRTLPMRRGSWVLRELFNDAPNDPPPNAGEIQPNTAGKSLTVRQRLELHRSDTVCASCHAKLDPYGLALENYDAIGQWREKANGEGFKPNQAPVLDVSGTFPGGRKFATLEEYKAGLVSQKERFARAFAAKLTTYALGRPVGYADLAAIDGMVARLKKNDYRIGSLIDAVVATDAFTTK